MNCNLVNHDFLKKRSHPTDFINLVKTNDRKALEVFYHDQKESFFVWAKRRFDCDDDTIIDVFQDAIVTLYFNVKEDRITKFEINVEAYLFGIAKNLLLKKNLKAKREKLVGEFKEWEPQLIDVNIYNRFNVDKDHFNYELQKAFRSMQSKCKSIIQLYYYHRFTLESIANRLGYNNTDTVKARKNQCMKQLRALLQNKI